VAEELEDLFLPFRAKRQSKANLSRRRGLEPLADYIQQQGGPTRVEDVAMGFLSFERKVLTVAEAIGGALLIVADRISQDTEYRKWLRNLMLVEGEIRAKAVKNKKGRPGKYASYDDFSEKVSRIPSHRMLAVRRGTREKFLTYSIEIDDLRARSELRSRIRFHAIRPSAELIQSAIDDAYRRLLRPVIESEVRHVLKERAESEAVMVFEENLSALLLAPPAGRIRIMGIDPVGKGRSKLAVLNGDGGLVEHHSMRLSDSPARSPRPGARNAAESPESSSPTPPDPTPTTDPAPSAAERPATEFTGTTSTSMELGAESSPPQEDTETPAPLGEGSPDFNAGGAGDTSGQAVSSATSAVSPATSPATSMDGGDANEGTNRTDVPRAPAAEADRAAPNPGATLIEILKRTEVKGVVIGSGAGSRPVEKFVRNVIRDHGLDIFVIVANEVPAGAYAISDRAAAEFADLDVPTRSAISIARRLQDPLAEMVKVEPKSIGVGQYQHDVDGPKLEASVEAAVETAVNRVGADLNSASEDLLRWISGLNGETARAIVAYREAHGPFTSREQLRSVPGIDKKAFTYAAGFLRVHEGTDPLDQSAIHPESYGLVARLAESARLTVPEIIGNAHRLRGVAFADFEDEAGKFALEDIRNELFKPGRDVRKAFAVPHVDERIREIDDLAEGMELEGTVTNVTNFGAFVDIGVGQDGLVHISELSHRYVSDARQAAQIGDVVKVKVIGVERAQKRISLSVKAATPKPVPVRRNRPRPHVERRPAQEARGSNVNGRAREGSRESREGSRESREGLRGSRGSRDGAREGVRDGSRKKARTATQAPVGAAERGSRAPRPFRDTPPKERHESISHLSMEEQIRRLREKFKGPDDDSPRRR
jgi:competence ComEA-like helix-hairpin-helix protein